MGPIHSDENAVCPHCSNFRAQPIRVSETMWVRRDQILQLDIDLRSNLVTVTLEGGEKHTLPRSRTLPAVDAALEMTGYARTVLPRRVIDSAITSVSGIPDWREMRERPPPRRVKRKRPPEKKVQGTISGRQKLIDLLRASGPLTVNQIAARCDRTKGWAQQMTWGLLELGVIERIAGLTTTKGQRNGIPPSRLRIKEGQ